MKPGRLLAYGLLSSLIGLAACSKSTPPPPPAPPPPPKVEAPKAEAPDVNAETKRLASEMYVYAYPLVLMDVTRQVNTAGTPLNTFAHKRTVPDATSVDAINPNADFLYSQAWLDLSKEPVILSVPDTKGRYYLIALLDAWTNVATSIGTRTTGSEKRAFAIVGPRWKGTLPPEVTEVKSPTDLAWLFARTQINGKADRAAASKMQEQLKVAPLATKGAAKGGAATAAPTRAAVDAKTDPRASPRQPAHARRSADGRQDPEARDRCRTAVRRGEARPGGGQERRTGRAGCPRRAGDRCERHRRRGHPQWVGRRSRAGALG
jgi:hypothetical protein